MEERNARHYSKIMTQIENSSSNPNNKIFSAKELRSLLRNPPEELIQDSYGESSILIEGYTFEDEYLILDNTVTVKLPLKFQNCSFKCSNLFFIDGLVCNESITFDSCIISDSIFFSSGTFKKEVILKSVTVKSIHLSHCIFEEISISGYNIDQLWISGAKFKSLIIGEYIGGDHINKLTIFAKEDETGDILVKEQEFDEIYLGGSNKGKTFNFERIKCNRITINNFKNEGSLNFFGFEPKDLVNNKRYFQISKSNLKDTQFYRTLFSNYLELIIIDSFITDCLFIGCEWSNNLRALNGPEHPSFENSIKSGRKNTHQELIAIKEAYRQLKISMAKHSDKIQEHKFYSEELQYHNKILKWSKPWKNQFWDKIILIWSKTFSDYGQSFIKPLFWLLFGHYILFVVGILFNGFGHLHVSLCAPTAAGFEEAFEKFFIYINPLRRFETSLSGYLIFLDLLMRIWSSYMIYNLIRASRRFIS